MLSALKAIFPLLLTSCALCAVEHGYHYTSPTKFEFNTNYDTPVANYQTQSLHDYNPSAEYADYQKEFYAYEAPYDGTADAADYEAKFAAAALQKKLRVVFIKAPENKALEGAFNALAKQTAVDKTAIYVLNKQTDAGELASKLSTLRMQSQPKPEVHFVKYRTPEEAALAQQHIQAHYDAYGGTTHHYNGGMAAVLNYAPSTVSASTGSTSFTGSFGGATSPAVGTIELPEYGTAYETIADNEFNAAGNDESFVTPLHKVDFRINERFRPGSKMVFPTDAPSNTYLPPYKRKR